MILPYKSMILYFSQLIWPLGRISGLFLSMPLVSSIMMPARIRILFAFALALIMMPFIPDNLSFLNFQPSYFLYVVNELLLGLLMGFAMQIVFQIFILGGQIIALQTGLGFAIMIDPASKASVPLVSQFYLMMVSLMFLALNGHLALLEALMESFRLKPVGQQTVSLNDIGALINFSGWMFKESVLIALPAILALLLVNLAFGVMTRVSPQLNIFSLGFPLTLLMGIIIIRISLPGVASQIGESIEKGMLFIKGILH